MRNCWKRNPSSRSDTLRLDLADFATRVVEIIQPNPRGFDAKDIKMHIRKVPRKTNKQGWFRNVWDVEFVEHPQSGRSSVSARVINVSVLDSARVSSPKFCVLYFLTESSFRAMNYGIRCTGVGRYSILMSHH